MSTAFAPYRRRILSVLLILACASAVQGCVTSFVAAAPKPSAALLLPCRDPDLVPDPDNATAEQINIERLNVARAYADCRQKQAALAKWVKETSGP